MPGHPRRDGIWDRCLTAMVAKICLDREGTTDAPPPPTERMQDLRLSFEVDGNFKIVLRNWGERFKWSSGREQILCPW